MPTLPRPDEELAWTGDDPDGERGLRQRELLVRYGLTPDTRLVEIGCGLGRLAYHLADFLDGGTYAGFDIAPDAITWLQEHYTTAVPALRFDLVDVHNPFFRPDVPEDAPPVRFPYDDAAFDMGCSFAVFMHMVLPDIRHYLHELARVLRPGATAVLTFMAIGSPDDLTQPGQRTYTQVDDGVYTRFPEFPGRSMAYDDALIRTILDEAGFDVVDLIEGGWRHPGPLPDGGMRPGPDLYACRRR